MFNFIPRKIKFTRKIKTYLHCVPIHTLNAKKDLPDIVDIRYLSHYLKKNEHVKCLFDKNSIYISL